MRTEDGTYVGAHTCRHHRGIDRYISRECCGGRILKLAFIECALRGSIEAEIFCNSHCEKREEKNLQNP
jgi:hypothetical protein